MLADGLYAATIRKDTGLDAKFILSLGELTVKVEN
jgi:hypothetical protein